MAYPSSLFTPYHSNDTDTFIDVKDEYDPEKPNSYLLYCQNRDNEDANAQRVFRAKQELADNELHRIKERKQLEEDIKTGAIFHNRSLPNQGRGAVMTLPAWMTEGITP